MSAVTIDSAAFEQLARSQHEVQLVGPDGRSAGYFVPRELYETMRQCALDRLSSEVTEEDCRRALADPKRHTMDEVWKLLGND